MDVAVGIMFVCRWKLKLGLHTLPAETMDGALGFPGGRTVTTARRTAVLAAVRLINY